LHHYGSTRDGGVVFQKRKKKREGGVAVGLVGQPRDSEAELKEERLYGETVIPYW
jgi:hypothetical protein